MPDHDQKKFDSQFKTKAVWALRVMEKIHYFGIALIVAGVLFFRIRGLSMLWLIGVGGVIVFLSLGWAMLFWDCPHCGKNLRTLRSILKAAKFCPYCGKKF